jgi:hypothetical protein
VTHTSPATISIVSIPPQYHSLHKFKISSSFRLKAQAVNTMIPISYPQEAHSSSCMNYMMALPRKRIIYTSSDELCAASVLISLSPRADELPRHHQDFRRPEYPTSDGRPHAFKAQYGRWERCHYRFNGSPLEIEQAAHPRIVSDTGSYTSEVSSSHSFDSAATASLDSTCWHEGSTSLALPEDDDVLSPLHCFMRRYCVEAFSATREDVTTPRYGKSHGVKIVVGQVGIRCLYCAVCYPSSLENIYHSIETWQRRHSLVCSHIPSWVRKSILELMESSKSRAGGRRKYWEDSAKQLGMVNTSHGVRFSRIPGDLGSQSLNGSVDHGISTNPVVREEDRDLVTPYLFLLLEQMQTCRFTEEDRTGGRSKIKDNDIGFRGMQCKHCHGKAGFGRYFPTSASALALANSDRNIYNHIKKCRRCPIHVKAELRRLSMDSSHSKNRRGLRKTFFNRIWERIHNTDTC